MRRPVVLCLAGVLGPCGLAAQEMRQFGAHVHGASVLNIAVEGSAVAMELEVPALDIVGFERAPSSDAHRAAIDTATMTLSKPLDVFVFPAVAGCAVNDASVEHVIEDDERDARAGYEHERGEAHGDGKAHSEFRAVYEMSCADPSAIDAIDFAFFSLFPGAQSVEVQVITEYGQAAFQLERARPRVALDEVLG